jgi:hypothetical protein
MYFWGTVAVLFVLACAMGWKLDRKHKVRVIGRARDSVDARGNETLRHDNHIMGGGGNVPPM